MPFCFSEETIRVLQWLWCLPWASATDIARITGLPEKSVSAILHRGRTRGWLLSARLGRVSDVVHRFVFSNTGVQAVQDRWGWQVYWWHRPASLKRLAGRLELIETAYKYLPGLWQSNLVSEATCWVYEDRPGISDNTGEPVMRAELVGRDWTEGYLSGFYWMEKGPFEAIAIYENEKHDDGEFFLPVLWRGNFHQSRDITDVMSDMRSAMIEDERRSKLPLARVISPHHHPSMIIFCPDRVSAAVVQKHWQESLTRERQTRPAIIDATGQIIRSMPAPTNRWQGFYLPEQVGCRRLGDIGRMVDGLTRGSYAALNGLRSWRVFRAVDGSPAVTLAQIAEAAKVSPSVAANLLDPMVKAHVMARKEGHYLDELGTRMLADSQHIDIRRTNRRWAVYQKSRGEYRGLQRRHNQGQSDVVLVLRRHGFEAFPAMGVSIEYVIDGKRVRVNPDAFVILPPGVLVAVEYERSAKAPSRVKVKARPYGRLVQVRRPIPVLVVTETMQAAMNFAALGHQYLLATTLDAVRQGPHGRDRAVPGDPGCWCYWFDGEEGPTANAAIDMWSQIYAEEHPEGVWLVPMDNPCRVVRPTLQVGLDEG